MNTRWPVSPNFEERMKWLSSKFPTKKVVLGAFLMTFRHYQDAYNMLVIMFGSPAILPPRTKRWAEAKVLADTINIKVRTALQPARPTVLTIVKIIKLYLYNNEHALALSHHSTHIRKFGDFSRGWGIGEETFEFWSWVARQ
jgi:hypothetical protein